MLRHVLTAATFAAAALIGASAAQAEVRLYWDQAEGRMIEYHVGPGGYIYQAGRASSIQREEVAYAGPHGANTIVVNTAERRLYYVYDSGKAIKYGVGVGREGFQWAGTHRITRKAEWPGWTPPPAMRKRQPDLPAYMEGGIDNPLGARALYIGDTLYRIHGSNEPWTIGHAVSSGCIRMTNEDVEHLYELVKVGTRVVVVH